MDDKRMYILVNENIKISKGKLGGQIGHAVLTYAYYRTIKPLMNNEAYEDITDYMEEQKKILLSCPEEKLLEFEREGGYAVIRDKGYTELEPNTLTCVNYGIKTRSELPEWIKSLKLYH